MSETFFTRHCCRLQTKYEYYTKPGNLFKKKNNTKQPFQRVDSCFKIAALDEGRKHFSLGSPGWCLPPSRQLGSEADRGNEASVRKPGPFHYRTNVFTKFSAAVTVH